MVLANAGGAKVIAKAAATITSFDWITTFISRL
jgi:hypothetical protein